MRVWFDGQQFEAEWDIYIHSGPSPWAARWNVVVYRLVRP